MEKHADIITKILLVHALTSCDTMACCYMYGVAERNSSEVFRAGSHSLVLHRLVDVDLPMNRSSNVPMRSCHHAMDAGQVNQCLKQGLGCRRFKPGAHHHQLHIYTDKAFAENAKKSSLLRIEIITTVHPSNRNQLSPDSTIRPPSVV
jgi:hypothetical protein